MLKGTTLLISAALLAAVAGCSDRPHEYGQQRPDVGSLDSRDRGLQSKDLLSCTELMAQDMLADRDLNASRTQWTVVAARMENQTTSRTFPYDIFLDSLKTRLAREGKGRVTLIENKSRFHGIQNQEVEKERDDFGQGATSGMPAGIQPDYALYGKAQEMRNSGTSTYRVEFTIVNLKTRVQVWQNDYLVKTDR